MKSPPPQSEPLPASEAGAPTRASVSTAFDLARHPVHLGQGARVLRLPAFTGDLDWYARYAEAHAADGVEGRLVSLHAFDAPWTSWEVHPHGEELVVCLTGRIVLLQELGPEAGDEVGQGIDRGVQRILLEAGQAAINPAGVWHTADVEEPATALFVTAGLGTRHRSR